METTEIERHHYICWNSFNCNKKGCFTRLRLREWEMEKKQFQFSFLLIWLELEVFLFPPSCRFPFYRSFFYFIFCDFPVISYLSISIHIGKMCLCCDKQIAFVVFWCCVMPLFRHLYTWACFVGTTRDCDVRLRGRRTGVCLYTGKIVMRCSALVNHWEIIKLIKFKYSFSHPSYQEQPFLILL